MRYQRSYLFVFEQPRWAQNILYTGLCALVPLVGWALLVGYLTELLEAMHERPEEPYPDFAPNRVAEYLTRGLGPFVIHSLVLLPLMLLVAVAVIVGSVTSSSGEPSIAVKLFATVIGLGVA